MEGFTSSLDHLPNPKPDQGWQGFIPSMRDDSIDAIKDGEGSLVENLFKNGAKKHTNPKPDQGWKGSLPAWITFQTLNQIKDGKGSSPACVTIP